MEHNPNLGFTAMTIYLEWYQQLLWARWGRLVQIALRYLARLQRQLEFDNWTWLKQLRRRGPPGF